MFTSKSYFINSHSQTKRSCGMPADRWFLQTFVFSDHFKYYDPNHCEWKVEDQAPCKTEGPTTVPTTTNADMDYCEQLDSKWTCSSGLGTHPECPSGLFATFGSFKMTESHSRQWKTVSLYKVLCWQLYNRTSQMFVQTIRLFLVNKRKIMSRRVHRGR